MRLNNRWMGFLILFPLLAEGQLSLFPQEKQTYLWTEGSFQMWRIQGAVNAVTQVAFPFTLYVPFSDKLSMTVNHVPAYAKWGEYSLKGLSDTWVQGTYLAGSEKWMLNLGMGLPTGKTRLNNTEMLLTQTMLTRNIYAFRLPVYGQGFCVKAGGAAAYPVTPQFILGVGGQVLMHTAYHPMSYSYTYGAAGQNVVKQSDIRYKPGNELTVQLGLDYRAGENTKFMLDGIVTQYGRDVLDGNEIYGSGHKVLVIGGLYYQYDEQYLLGSLTYRMRGKHELLQGVEFTKSDKNLNGDQIETEIVWKAIAFRDGQFLVLANGRFYLRNENDNAGATIFGGGFGVDYKLSPRTVLNFHLRYWGGNLKDADTIRRAAGDANADLIRNAEGLEVAWGFKFSL
jgi:hypothetical protein